MAAAKRGRLNDFALGLYNNSVGALMKDTAVEKHILGAYSSLVFHTSPEKVKRTAEGIEIEFISKTRAECTNLYGNFSSEKILLDEFLRSINQGSVVYDIGANIGSYTCFGAKKAYNGRVHAFEPYPPNYERLKDNLALNGLDAHVEPLAISKETGYACFDTDERGEAGSGWGQISPSGTMKVNTVSLDDFIEQGNPQPEVVKIDVEGSELEVLEGGSKSFSSDRCQTVYVEVHKGKMKGTSKQVKEVLKGYGFDVELLASRPDHELLKASKR